MKEDRRQISKSRTDERGQTFVDDDAAAERHVENTTTVRGQRTFKYPQTLSFASPVPRSMLATPERVI
jgi:hypothetical protein